MDTKTDAGMCLGGYTEIKKERKRRSVRPRQP